MPVTDFDYFASGNHSIQSIPNDSEALKLKVIDVPPSGSSKGTILLIHGFPQTSYQFRKVIPSLARAGYRVIAPDYRGAGDSSKPVNGYTKTQMSTDIHTLLTSQLGIKEKVHVVGHDIGGMVAHAYAAQYPDDVASVVWGECPLPGSTFYEENKTSMRLWHFVFHRLADLPEALTAGNERVYLQNFFNRLSHNAAGITPADLDYYASVYALPGGMRSGFNVYRAFEEDGVENRRIREEKGKCRVRCLLLNGEFSFLGEEAGPMAREFYEDFEVEKVAGSAHWIAEENPEGFVEKVLAFVGRK